MNYQKIYDSLIQKRRDFPIFRKDQYCENHHIVPFCISQDNSEENLVNLFPEEHFLAHLLLIKIYPDNYKLISAFHMMCGFGKYKVNNKEYKWARLQFSKMTSERMKGFPTYRDMSGTNNPMFGKSLYSVWIKKYGLEKANLIQKEYNDKISKAGLRENNPNRGRKNSEEGNRHCSEAQLLYASREDYINPMKGKHHKEESKKLISIKSKNQEKIKCEFCEIEFRPATYKRYHGDNCKLKPGNENIIYSHKIYKEKRKGSCVYCGIIMDLTNLSKHHNDNCKNKGGI